MNVQPTTEIVWSELSAELRRFIRRRADDDYLADDIQEAFVRTHRHIGTLEQSEHLAAWLYQIARNVMHDDFQKRNGSAVELGTADLPRSRKTAGFNFGVTPTSGSTS